MNVLFIFLVGIVILVGAIALNIAASYIGLMSWFEFVKNPGAAGVLSYLWLFIGYPFGLGVIAYAAMKFFNF